MAALTLAVVFVAAGVVFADRVVTPEELEDSLAPAPSEPVAVPIELRVLSTTLVGRGQVEFDGQLEIALPVLPGLTGASPIVTGLPEPSLQIAAGDVLLEVAYRPVIALAGPNPMVRDLVGGDTGPDVAALQSSLVRLGLLDADNAEDDFGPLTAAAIEQLYDRAGYAPPIQDQAVSVPMGEIIMLPDLPMYVREVTADVGDALTPDATVLTLSSAAARLVVALPSFDTALLGGGETVEITDDATGNRTEGTVAEIGVVPDPELGGVPVAIEFIADLPADRDYRAAIEITTTGDPVLAVPDTAVRLGTGDTSYVLVLESPSTKRIAVDVGILGSDGYVQITAIEPGAELSEGDLVVVGAAP